jgi:hypothetical protein
MLNRDDILDNSRNSFSCEIIGDIEFRHHTFYKPLDFNQTIFTGTVIFENVTFKKSVSFDGAKFNKPICFIDCKFEQGANFSLAHFKACNFFQSCFTGRVMFWHTDFDGDASFKQVKFLAAQQNKGENNFSWSTFHKKAIFEFTEFYTPAYFHRTIFNDEVQFDESRFMNLLHFWGKQNDVLCHRFDVINPDKISTLTHIFTDDTERHRTYKGESFSEFLCFNNILSTSHLREQLSQPLILSDNEIELIVKAWEKGNRKMFADGHLVTFRGAIFKSLDDFKCHYVDLSMTAYFDKNIFGTKEQRQLFEQKLTENSFDVFISHASEDKAIIVRELNNNLRRMGWATWLDEKSLKVGDQLNEKLEQAMCQCCSGVIILSPNYIQKRWTKFELERLLELSETMGKNLYFVWYMLDENQVRTWSPVIANRIAANVGLNLHDIDESTMIEQLAEKLAKIMRHC